MSNKLIIVESPTKVHTIKKFLGSGYEVIASQGHIRDLPKSTLGVDVEHDFEPKYITIRGKGELVAALKKEIKKADKIFLATDPDREGEAISWHLQKALPMDKKEVRRITFNEITKNAIKEALKNPRDINMDLVDAQQARRVLDRVVGYQISPVLWKKVKGKLSAGRVQSAVLRMVCDREEEISSFIPQEYWTVEADLSDEKAGRFKAEFYGKKDGKITLSSEKEVQEIEKSLEGQKFTLEEVKKTGRSRTSPLPFTTSSLQIDAANRLNFSTSKTMRLAQQLYEGVSIKGHGTIGLITYLRTDSTRISEEADRACKAFIGANYGEEYLGSGQVRNSDSAQDAHEAIRPSDVTLTPEEVKADLQRDAFRLYQLIWKRFVASRMKAASYDHISVRIAAGDCEFTAAASKLTFPGFLSVYESEEKEENKKSPLFALKEGSALKYGGLVKEQHFTAPPAHFTEASLVRAMEEKGLGRPSTYAPTITNILGRHYLAKEGKNLFVTELGDVVNHLMCNSFPDIVDLSFTAHMENQLDLVAEGKKDWREMMKDFYPNFEKEVERAEKELEKVKVADEVSDVPCDLCGRMMVIKYGSHGKFLACPGFPDCRNTKSLLEKAGVSCPKCGQDIIIRRSKKGRRFFACENTECDFISWTKPKEDKKA